MSNTEQETVSRIYSRTHHFVFCIDPGTEHQRYVPIQIPTARSFVRCAKTNTDSSFALIRLDSAGQPMPWDGSGEVVQSEDVRQQVTIDENGAADDVRLWPLAEGTYDIALWRDSDGLVYRIEWRKQ